MFKVNDFVVYGLTGVCKISDIRKDEYNSKDETQYYVLNPVFNNNMTIKVPVSNQNILMRSIITKDDALSLIAKLPQIEDGWIDDEKQRNAAFKSALRSGKVEEWAKIIKTIYLQKEVRSVVGKKLAKMDEDIMNTAEKNLNEEFSVVLNISPNEVVRYINKHIPQKL
ncbi:MAG TPA: CarD family transcriptional regulator [Syntrophomonadaceae bacterium]|nr:CarD family transcriptional regulator [Syntrophomonadaceae bacterium]